MKKVKNIQLMWLIGFLIILISGCGKPDFQSLSDHFEIKDATYNLIVTSNFDCSTCIDQIIFGKKSSVKYYGVIFSHSKLSSLSDFEYAEETEDWISWTVFQDSDLFLEIIRASCSILN
ncbi:hypothetical protein [Arthrospiribacter ruber]|uniref:Lipoprotein n=1 Tax=Arthrospiribacter ruber TaxID=2487934 RepID=A0A951MJQ9_9BACT|nr:hypothetical protein [Arthrospiribacter ruber]MBW3470151.1 hypothetical protein [Arthrospiribacter ruber]